MTLHSIYRRPLPDELVAFASEEGRRLFREALSTGHMESFFALSEQFHTQADPAFCGLGSLVVVLNALAIDPGRLWKGPWRWFSEELLDCCSPLERVREKGVSLDELACLAQCNGADVRVARGSIEALREDVVRSSRSPREPMVVASYSRRALGQTGEGHFSPIGGYHPERDLVLLLDVARFKYPPHWVPLEKLHAAMQPVDPETGAPRGWMVLTRRASASAVLFSISTKTGIDHLVRALTTDVHPKLAEATDARAAIAAFARALADAGAALEVRETVAPEHAAAADAVREALRATETHAVTSSEAVSALVLAAPDATWSALADDVRRELAALLERDRAHEALASEIRRMREQLEAVARFASRRC